MTAQFILLEQARPAKSFVLFDKDVTVPSRPQSWADGLDEVKHRSMWRGQTADVVVRSLDQGTVRLRFDITDRRWCVVVAN